MREWVKRTSGSYELRDGDSIHAIVERSTHRGYWWWCTWGRATGDTGNLECGTLRKVQAIAAEATDR